MEKKKINKICQSILYLFLYIKILVSNKLILLFFFFEKKIISNYLTIGNIFFYKIRNIIIIFINSLNFFILYYLL